MSYKVLFFYSGVGGLSIYAEVMQALPHISPIYLFDNKYCPYGNKLDSFVQERVTQLLIHASQQLDIDLIVLACNTASTVALDSVRANIQIPVVGVVPAIKPAAHLTKNGIVGLLATPATIRRAYTFDLIAKYASNVNVLRIGSTKLVDIAERKIAHLPYQQEEIAQELQASQALPISEQPDVIVLGCTHFPHIKEEIAKCLPNALLIDSGKAIANRVTSLLSVMPEKVHMTNTPKAYCTCTDMLSDALQQSFTSFGFTEISQW